MKRLLCSLIIVLGPSTAAVAQDQASALERVEVTGSRISYRDLQDTPAISITKPGDYLLQALTLINDSRQEQDRKREIYDTIEKMVSRAGGKYTILFGDAYRVALDKSNLRVELTKDSKRPDVSTVELQVQVNIAGSGAGGEQQVNALREFVRQTPKVGRTEIDLDAETALGMNKPERYRYELIAAIADDSRRVGANLGAGCKVEMGGLNSRIAWERVSATDLLLYVPYTMKISDCVGSGAPR